MLHPDAATVAGFIEAIPSQDKDAVSIESLSRLTGLTTEAASALIALLGTTGSVTVASNAAAGSSIRATNTAASYFLKSLALYVRGGDSILINWERPGTAAGPYTSGEVLAGPQFLYLMERQRLARTPASPPLRKAEIAQVLVKGRVRGRGQDLYLAQYDNSARQFQLLGGHRRSTDSTLHETAIRELEEELSNFSFDPDRDALVELGQVEATQLSRTYGVCTLYQMSIFQLRSERQQLTPSPGARWLAADELLKSNSEEFNFTGIRKVVAKIPGGVTDLPFSLKSKQKISFKKLISEHPWESWGLLVGILGIIVSIVFFFLSL